MTFNLTAIKNASLLSLACVGASLMIPAAVTPASAAGVEVEAQAAQANPVLLNNAIASTPSVSAATINLVKQHEGFSAKAYIDTSGLPVIGYGQTRVRGKRVKMGQWISKSEADAELVKELYLIQRTVKSHVRVKLTPNQLGALTSFAYNAGMRVVTSSTLARKLNAGNYAGAANEFVRWNKANKGGKLVPFAGLTRRRQAERALFLTP